MHILFSSHHKTWHISIHDILLRLTGKWGWNVVPSTGTELLISRLWVMFCLDLSPILMIQQGEKLGQILSKDDFFFAFRSATRHSYRVVCPLKVWCRGSSHQALTALQSWVYCSASKEPHLGNIDGASIFWSATYSFVLPTIEWPCAAFCLGWRSDIYRLFCCLENLCHSV